MAGCEYGDMSAADLDFLENSHLSYIVPYASNPDLDHVLKPESGGSRKSPFKTLEQRDFLFFDESVDVHLILRTPQRDDDTLRGLLSRVALSLEVYISNASTPSRDQSPPASEVIFSDDAVERTIKAAPNQQGDGDRGPSDDSKEADSFLILRDERDAGEDRDGKELFAFVIWKVPVFIARPRIRLQSPTVVFSAVARLRASDTDKSGTESALNGGRGEAGQDGYMQSRMPVGLNLLEPFASDPALRGLKPRLSAQRVSLVAPVTQSEDEPRLIRGLQSINFKVVAAVHTRVKFARPNVLPAGSTVIAMLELDFTPYFECEAALTNITLGLPSGVVTDLNVDAGLSLPLSCVAHDHLTFLYRLAPADHEHLLQGGPGPGTGIVAVPGAPRNPTAPASRDLDISIEVRALLRPGECTPRLHMAWSTPVDFTPPVNPGFGASSNTPPLQRGHRPSQLSIDGSASMVAPAVSRPDALPGLEAAQQQQQRHVETSVPDFGITMTFTGPSGPVHVGEEFSWTVFVVNRSGGAALLPHGASTVTPQPPAGAPRKLALRVIPKQRRRGSADRVVRPPTRQTAKAGDGHVKVADAVLDENIVHAMQRNSLVEGADILYLSADARVGPLAPGACHVVELRFLALRAGVLNVESVRVVDLVSQEHVDIRELPAIVVQPELKEDFE